MKVNRQSYQTIIDGKPTDLYYLQNKNGISLSATNYGGRIVELYVPDKNECFDDIVLGHDTLDEYVNFRGERFLGAVAGRFANRIANGKFILDGKEYQLPLNDGSNSLHGGYKGFDMVVWDVQQPDQETLIFTYISVAGEEGFPGNLKVKMIYKLTDENELIINYHATTDRTTVVNLTHHSFFNLSGEGKGSINNHIMQINASRFLPIDGSLIPTGKVLSVENTPMDFRTPKAIGKEIEEQYEQLLLAKGYDHNWVLNRKTTKGIEFAASVYEPTSGRTLEVWTTEPGIQFYSGNFFDGKTIGKGEKIYTHRTAFALETQHFPDSPNRPQFPSTILSPGEDYRHTCIYKFGVKTISHSKLC